MYLGGGTGIVYSPLRKLNVRNQIIIPFFGEIKYSFLKNSIVSPFVDVVAGGAYNYSSYGTGYLLKPSVGLDVWRFSASVGIGRYAINYASVEGRQMVNRQLSEISKRTQDFLSLLLTISDNNLRNI